MRRRRGEEGGGGGEKEDFSTTQSEKHMPTDFMIFFAMLYEKFHQTPLNLLF